MSVVSLTAMGAAMRRAAHQLLDRPIVFEDPLAVSVLGPALEARLQERLNGLEREPAARSLRAFLAARSRLAEEELGAAVARGTKQYVVLGAGLDTFAHRNPHPDVRVFEVDAPATQAWKRELVQHREHPANLVYAPTDFEHDSLADGLARAGFDPDAPAFFSWLGVVPYLTRAAAFDTLRFIASRPLPSAVVFDYAVPREHLQPSDQIAFDTMQARVSQAGEPLQLFLDPVSLERELLESGFRVCADFDAAALNTRYLANRADGLAIGSRLGHVMIASR